MLPNQYYIGSNSENGNCLLQNILQKIFLRSYKSWCYIEGNSIQQVFQCNRIKLLQLQEDMFQQCADKASRLVDLTVDQVQCTIWFDLVHAPFNRYFSATGSNSENGKLLGALYFQKILYIYSTNLDFNWRNSVQWMFQCYRIQLKQWL